MARISVGDFIFDLLPSTASWSYKMNINSIDTYGGKVVQLLSCVIESLTIDGLISPKNPEKFRWRSKVEDGKTVRYREFLDDELSQWQGMREFEHNVKQIMLYHEVAKQPVYFRFDEVGWSGDVYLTGYTDVRFEVDIPAVRYKLSFDVDSGFETIAAAVRDEGLTNIPEGVGWIRSKYNTPPTDYSAAIKAAEKVIGDSGNFSADRVGDFYEYLKEAMKSEEDAKDAAKDAANKIVDGAKSAIANAVSKDVKFMKANEKVKTAIDTAQLAQQGPSAVLAYYGMIAG